MILKRRPGQRASAAEAADEKMDSTPADAKAAQAVDDSAAEAVDDNLIWISF